MPHTTSIPAGRAPLIDRTRKRRAVLEASEPIVLLEAPAGTGKSVLLSQLAAELRLPVHRAPTAPPETEAPVILWDIPPHGTPAPLPEVFASDARRIVIAKRPETALPGLDRAELYGHVRRFGTTDLLIERDELLEALPARHADRILAGSRGWPLLVGGAPAGATGLARFLESEFVAPMSGAELAALAAWLDGHPVEPATPGLLPLLDLVRPALAQAVEAALAARRGDREQAAALATGYVGIGLLTEAATTFQAAGRYDDAFAAFAAGGGRFYLYRQGSAAVDRILAGFPAEYALGNDTLVMSLAMQALKRGEVARARRLIADRFGSGINDVRRVFTSRDCYSTDLVAFRVVMLIYEDYQLTDELFDQVFGTLADLPVDAHILRGAFYNSVLEFYIRSRQFAAAEDVAQRALHHYEQASVPMLAFYIALHRALMRLLMGDAINARQHAEQAARYLGTIGFDSPGDARLLKLLDACIDYEGGKPEPLARFLSTELDDFIRGEIWPSLIEFALHYGSQALSEHFSTIAARNFLDRWRVYQVSNRQFGVMIELREAAILQNANRWQEAAEKTAALATHITRAWVAAAGEELERLKDRDEIVQAMIWLRHIVYEQPTRPHLERQLGHIIRNLNLTGRQRLCAEVWLAFVHKRQRNLSRARALLQKVFEEAARLGAIAPLAEERVFLVELVEQQRIGQYLEISAPVRQVLRRLRDGGLPNSALGAQNGLSRRETKVLMMISEGSSNKFIANALGLSEATVKFHLSNTYRKLGCTRRREAISAARALGLVS
ncbi:MAG: response regulator transcription factor [Devosia sp.]